MPDDSTLDLKEFVEEQFRFARQCLQDRGSFNPMAFFLLPHNKVEAILIDPEFLATSASKDMLAKALISRAQDNKGIVLLLTDSWILNSGSGVSAAEMQATLTTGIATHPKRTEAITGSIFGVGIDTILCMMPYKRTEAGPVFEPVNWLPSDGKAEGRFTPNLSGESQKGGNKPV